LIPQNNGEADFEVYSYREDGEKSILHSKGRIIPFMQGQGLTLDIEAAQAGCEENTLVPGQYYKAYKNMGIDYGPSFKGIEQV
jgi:hypothetical protein